VPQNAKLNRTVQFNTTSQKRVFLSSQNFIWNP
jgi:hypothetical protein